jgi:hypothetical protein
MWGQDNEVLAIFSKFKKVGLLKNSNLKNILNDIEMENLGKLVFRHT